MANPFEDFIQVEMPKRPYLAADVAPESIIIRRGAGPRQLAGLQLSEGQLLGMQDGKLAGVDPKAVGTPVDAFPHIQTEPSATWTINHNRNNVNVLVQMYGSDGKRFDPDDVTVAPNTVTITMHTPASGHVVLLFIPTPAPEVPPEE